MTTYPSSLSITDLHTFQVGALTKAWAGTELMIDIAVAIAYGNLGGDQIAQEMPRALSKKLPLLRKLLSTKASSNTKVTGAVAVIGCTSECSHFRNLCVHSVAIYDGENFVSQYFERFQTHINHTVTKISQKDLNDAGAQAQLVIAAWSRLVPLVCELAEIELPARLRVSPVKLPTPRPDPTYMEKRLFQAIQRLGG